MPWQLREDRKSVALDQQASRVRKRLFDFSCDVDVTWINGNSYVCVQAPAEIPAPILRAWFIGFDTGEFAIASIDNHGAIRWTINPDYPELAGDDGAEAAIRYFLQRT